MNTILVTGALGHIGSALLREAPRVLPGTTVRILDNLSTLRYCSLFGLPPEGRYDFREGDMHGPELVSAMEGVDAVVHLAGITDAAGSAGNPQAVFHANFDGTVRVAEECASRGIPILFASTTSVYGVQSDLVDESCPDSGLKPQSPYAESKLKAEKFLAALGEERGLRWTVCRFGTIFGVSPGMRFHTAVNKFVWQASLRQPITVWRTALDQKRPYLDLKDAVEAIAFLVRGDHFDREVLNVVTRNATVREITDIIAARIGDLRIEFVDTAIMNQLSYEVLAQRIQAKGFRFHGDLDGSIHESLSNLAAACGRPA